MYKLFRELRRREVFRTAGLYVGISWIVIEGASILLPAFEIDDWVLRALIILAFVGMPVTLALAWFFDLSEHGIEVQGDESDEAVAPLGSRRMDFVVIGVLSVALIFSVYLNLTGPAEPLDDPDPISLLIADFKNTTGDPLFDGTLEQALQIGLESAPFVAGYRRDAALTLASTLHQATALDEATARLVAVREGVKLVMSGGIDEEDGRYQIYVRALDPKAGEVLASADVTARDKLEVLAAIGELAGDVREELGDRTIDRERLRDSETFTAKNLEAAKAYAEGQSLAYRGRYEESIKYFKEALDLDPQFGRAYTTLALSAGSLGRTDEAKAYWEKALEYSGTMTDRERLRTFAIYYSRVTRNREKAIEAYTELVEKYPADDAAHNGLAIQHFYTLDFGAAREAGQKLLEIYPDSVMGRSNFALYAMYASDFEAAAVEAREVRELDPDYAKGWFPAAMQALSAGDHEAAREAYRRMADIGFRGASTASLGLADIALFEGDDDRARTLLEQGIERDLQAGSQYFAATKYLALAEAEYRAGDVESARQAVSNGLESAAREAQSVPAAILYLQFGDTDRAREIAITLRSGLQPVSRAYGLLIDALVALEDDDYAEAIDTLSAARERADLWLVRFYRGRAYLAAGLYAEALDEFSDCMNRRGEATAIFLDDLPTWRYTATLPYWLGRAKEGLGMRAEAQTDYSTFVERRPQSDPLAADARQRMQ